MKKISYPLFLMCFALLAACSVCINQWTHTEKAVDKNMNLRIVQANSYHRAAYSHSTAMVTVMIISLQGRTMDTLLVKDYPDFKLKNLPSYSKQFSQDIHVPNVADKKEQIILLYKVIYTSKESVLTVPSINYIQKGATNDDFIISI